MNILVVDHDLEAANALRKKLLNWRHWATIVTTGKEALELASQCRFDLLLMDLFLPDAMGHTLVPDFKMLSPQTEIILMTGYHTRQLEREARIQGIAYYLIKPFEMKHLHTLVNHLSQRKGGTKNEDPRG